MALLIAIILPACKAGLYDVFGIVREVTVGECLRKANFVIVDLKIEEGVLHPALVVKCQDLVSG